MNMNLTHNTTRKVAMLTVGMGLALSLVTTPAQAGFLTFTNQANWEAALADPTLLEDFEGETAGGLGGSLTTTNGGVAFTFPSVSKFGFPKILAPAGGDTLELDILVEGRTRITTMVLPMSVIAWGADFDNPSNPFGTNVGAVDSAVATILGEPFDFSNFFSLSPFAEGFFGVISMMGPFDTVTFYGKGDPQGVGIDNIRVGKTPAVPEPSTMLLLGTGLVGLIGYRWKKAQA